MITPFPYLIQGQNIIVVIGNNSHTINPSHICYNQITQAIQQQDWARVQDLIEPKKVILNYGSGHISIQGDRFFWQGQEIHNTLTQRIISMFQQGFPIEPMVRFMENLMLNPSRRAVQELYGFLEKGQLPITPDGCFLAYKKVRSDYRDVHTGTLDNSPGQILEMPRNQVDDDSARTCSTGLHFCSQEYLQHFGGDRVMIVKINPRDVVSIPRDYSETKGRCCRYEVVGELGVNPEQAFTQPVQDAAAPVVPADPPVDAVN